MPPCSGPYGGYGDVDGDGWVTEKDIRLVQKHLAGTRTLTAEERGRADVSGEGIISAKDVLFISQYVSGLIDTFLVCGI